MAVGEWDQRQLCSDGACIGVIGGDGTCKVCGRAAPNWGDERNRGLNPPPGDHQEEEDLATNDEYGDDDSGEYGDDEVDDDRGEDAEDDGADEGAVAEGAAAAEVAVAAAAVVPRREWSARRLCPDGACIGVIGASGSCKVCGRRVTGDAPASTTASSTVSGEIGATTATTASDEAGSPAAPSAPAEDPALAATVPASSAASPAGHELCSVTGCGGYIGDNGRCVVCGRGAS